MLRDSVLEGKAAPPFVVRLYAGGRKLSPALSEVEYPAAEATFIDIAPTI